MNYEIKLKPHCQGVGRKRRWYVVTADYVRASAGSTGRGTYWTTPYKTRDLCVAAIVARKLESAP